MENEKLILAPYTKIGLQNGVLFVGFEFIQMPVKDTHLIEITILLPHNWMSPVSVKEMRRHFADSLQSLKGFEELFQKVVDGPYVISVNYIKSGRYSRHARQYALSGADPRLVRDRLLKSHVTILGCGGIRNVVSVNLASAGIGVLHLVDADMVELSNLTRQYLFPESDIGRKKVDALKDALSCCNSEIQVTTSDLRIDTRADFDALPATDLVVLLADAHGLLRRVNRYCVA